MIERPSPNWNERKTESPLRYIVLHYTGMPSRDEALARLCDPRAEVSTHYLIDEDGEIYTIVPEDKRAWHAGKSFWRGETDMNSASVGIELVNPGHEFGYRSFPNVQIIALINLSKNIITRNNLDPQYALVGHADIAPQRKEDPGELFPWERLADNGLGLWPEEHPEDQTPVTWDQAFSFLSRIGYETDQPNGAVTNASLRAFQRRFAPEDFLSNATQDPLRSVQTCARLRRLARMHITTPKQP